MRESRPYGSVRGARSNARPYRDSVANPALLSVFIGVHLWFQIFSFPQLR